MRVGVNKHSDHSAGPLLVVYIQSLVLLLLIFFVALCMHDVDLFTATSTIYAICALLVALFIWSLWSWKAVTKRLFDPYILFLGTATLFNGGHAFLEVFGLNENGILQGSFSDQIVVETLFLVILGLASFHYGALVSVTIGKINFSKESPVKKPGVSTARCIRLIGWGLFAVSFLPALFLLSDSVILVLSSGYFALYEQEVVTGFNAWPRILAAFLIPATLFLLAGSGKRSNLTSVTTIILLSYVIMMFFLGWRGRAMSTLIAYSWLWHRIVRPVPRTVLLSISLVMFIAVLPVIGITRSIVGEQRLSVAFFLDAYASIENPTIALISEMGGSMGTVARTLELVPAVRDFDMGLGYLYALLTAFPNLFWDIHPTIARGTASGWLVWEVAPYTASRGGSLAYSFIAEAYLNFGWVGAPLALGLMGFLFGNFVSGAEKSGDPAKRAMVASFLSFFLMFARSESADVVRPLLWYALLPYLAVRVAERLIKKSGTHPTVPIWLRHGR